VIAPPAPPPAPHVLTGVGFERLPNADDLAQYYPERAQRLEKQGSAVIKCVVNSRGGLTQCTVVSEDPQDYGFGDAALKVSHIFKLKPATSDGKPVDGGIFTTKITFRLADG
jgi:protein TonB